MGDYHCILKVLVYFIKQIGYRSLWWKSLHVPNAVVSQQRSWEKEAVDWKCSVYVIVLQGSTDDAASWAFERKLAF